ncbi:biopolymer transporter ExbB [Labrys okinawensis]|uniref:Biopolymer transporter ExbB n=1 Tax=Labrys okinawensis TaxID=346911 RepID=A0A2S9QB74_9HYPH|nr:MotA/TolQ/ExbB proton channel family protein [Labrys okinawensis]PRH86584.1 biopolymer transporter ExbB [Labrys okinawensis]
MSERQPRLSGADPLLPWLVFTGVSIFAFLVLWYFGFIAKMIDEDKTYISVVIVLLYIASSLHCLWRILAIGREGEAARRTAQAIIRDGKSALAAMGSTGMSSTGSAPTGLGSTPDGKLGHGLVAGHIRDLVTKAHLQGAARLDQTLLLRVLADRLRGSNRYGAFASDTLMKLGLLGTIVGFIMMLAPIAGLDTDSKEAVRSSMSLMSGGMAVAMYTTLVGLIGSILIKVQYHFLDGATSRIFSFAVDLTEVHVISALEAQRAPG